MSPHPTKALLQEKVACVGKALACPERLELLNCCAKARSRRSTREVLALDVRPSPEYEAGHLSHARSRPLDELKEAPGRGARGHIGVPTAAARSA
jgi:hypothetical protein